MIMGLRHDLAPGDVLHLTLRFRSGQTILAALPVISREQRPQS